ncbi:CIC11C00000002041 [Sungouiella intermedia]|uniref:triacylglycerol lipase n=1 Tax=Sungouiella intermedia TaxID=45354 RepID=A0A1L0BV68_9ASCO|nr:CIC11C00000002041 [[Candida] intermedia]
MKPTLLLTLIGLYNWSYALGLWFKAPSYHPEPIDTTVYSNLFTYAHLIDIAYCVDKFHQIGEPFDCELACSSRFPNMTLVKQWYFDDSVAGYIATTHSNIFQYKDPSTIMSRKKKTIVVSLRGTRSLYDTIADLKVDMVSYSNLRYSLPYCGLNCKIHIGFNEYFQNTIRTIHLVLENELEDLEDYELVMLGHSMGGSVALLLALHYLDLGYGKITLVTMGQPLVGNREFTTWADYVLGSYMPVTHNTFDRIYLRVVHKGDIVTTIPKNGGMLFEHYYQFDNQIYLNISARDTMPGPQQVVDCFSGDNSRCIAKDFQARDLISNNYYENHNTYFRRLGLCGILPV